MSKLNVVDSSAWLEYLTGSPRASQLAPAIEDIGNLVVPVITGYEVFKKVLLIDAAARNCGASLWTQDDHFKDLPGVMYFPKAWCRPSYRKHDKRLD